MGHTYIKQFIHCLPEIQIVVEVLYLANLKNTHTQIYKSIFYKWEKGIKIGVWLLVFLF